MHRMPFSFAFSTSQDGQRVHMMKTNDEMILVSEEAQIGILRIRFMISRHKAAESDGFDMTIDWKEGRRVYFAAANAAGGFVSQFGGLFSAESGAWDKIYIIKGGPGTGKSRLMHDVARYAEDKGYSVEYFLCSSDSDSLDGIRIPACGIAMLDGTAPHTMDPHYPGAVEEILNMGMFFDTRILHEKLPEIRKLQEENGAAHRLAARYLRAAGDIREGQKHIAANSFLAEKAERAACRLLAPCKKEAARTWEERYLSAISTKGVVHLSTARQEARHFVPVTDKRGTAVFFLNTLWETCRRMGISAVRYVTPLCPKETEGVYLCDTGVLYYSDRYGEGADAEKRINTDRFFDMERFGQHREKYRFAGKCVAALLEGACEALAEAGRVHDALEAHYISAMDFASKEAFTDRFQSSLFSNTL